VIECLSQQEYSCRSLQNCIRKHTELENVCKTSSKVSPLDCLNLCFKRNCTNLNSRSTASDVQDERGSTHKSREGWGWQKVNVSLDLVFPGNWFSFRAQSSASLLTIFGDRDDDLDFPRVTRDELLSRCEKELHFSTKPFNRSFSRKTNRDNLIEAKQINCYYQLADEDETPNMIRIFQWNILSQSKQIKSVC
jgi:hypothetical protein